MPGIHDTIQISCGEQKQQSPTVMQTCDESFEKLIDDIYTETGTMPFCGEVLQGPTNEELKKHLFDGTKDRTPLTFTVLLPQLTDKPYGMPVMVNGVLRYGKTLTWWKLLGFYLSAELQYQRVGIHYNADTRKGKVVLDPPPWR